MIFSLFPSTDFSTPELIFMKRCHTMQYVLKYVLWKCSYVPPKNLRGENPNLCQFADFEPHHACLATEIEKFKTIGSICGWAKTSVPNTVGIPSPTAEIGCFLGAWDDAHKHSSQYNFGRMTASNSVFDSSDGFSGSTYPMKTLPWSELLHMGNCQAVH